MKGFVAFVLFLATIAGLAFSSFGQPNLMDGQIGAIQNGSAMWVISQGLQSKSNAIILAKDSTYMFFAGIKGGWGFVGVNANDMRSLTVINELGITGAFANAKTTSDLAKMLESYGWAKVAAKEIPVIVKTVFYSANFARMATSFTTFIVAPVGVFNDVQNRLAEKGQS